MRTWSSAERRFAFPSGVVRLDRDVARALGRAGLCVRFDACCSYPYVARKNSPFVARSFQMLLHRWVWDWLVSKQLRKPLAKSQVLHHDDHDKLNNTKANLRAVTRSAHAREHQADRQRFSPRIRKHLGGFHRPRAPGPVRRIRAVSSETRELRGKTRAPAALQNKLAEMLPELRAQLSSVGRWVPVKRAAASWTSPGTYLLGLRRIRRRLSRADAALVGLMILNKMDAAQVAALLATSSAELAKLLRDPLVSEALQHFRRSGGLPYLLLPRR